MAIKDETGKRFGRWTVLGIVASPGRRGSYFSCRCECGTERDVSGLALRYGGSKSCGCSLRKKSKNPSDIANKSPRVKGRFAKSIAALTLEGLEGLAMDDLEMLDRWPLVGEEPPKDRRIPLELRLLDSVPLVAPGQFGLPDDWPAFDARVFYVTSGEGCTKARHALDQFRQWAEQVDRLVAEHPSDGASRYQRAVWDSVLKVGELLDTLIDLRGPNIWLEAWQDGGALLVCRKNPRPRGE